MNDRVKEPVELLTELFGNYRAEWLRERIFDLFTQPSYFPDLETKTPCVLMGGRGTGKTTVLRSLSYEGRYALSQKDINSIPEWDYYGFYYRVDTNRVTAFQGPELSQSEWTKLFAHYVNMLMCGQVLRFLNWYSLLLPQAETLAAAACQKVALSLRITPAKDVPGLIDQLDTSRIGFEAFLNNLSRETLPPMSLQGAPIDELLTRVIELPQFAGKHFFFLIDEFENFTDSQQVVMNTLIKHCGQNHSFKIGVKEMGWRKHATANPNEQLNSPADYVRISISERLTGHRFQEMAAQICNQRLCQSHIFHDSPTTIEELLPALTIEEEAKELGLQRPSAPKGLLSAELKVVNALSDLELFFCLQWAKWNDVPPAEIIREMIGSPKKWDDRYDNYKHALLFIIRRGKSGIRKYYAGWRTFVQLSGTNIRYLLELVHRALVLHRERGHELGARVSFADQTIAAQQVGMKNVSELEGLSVQGAQLTKLVLGLGRIFQVLAYHPEGHSPEQTQFALADRGVPPPDIVDLLNAAVMHLALVRSAGTKLATDEDVRAYDYSLHPIFAPFFVFSYRKKRKLSLPTSQLLGLVDDSKTAIREILSDTTTEEEAPLPEQLRLFEGYYGSAT